MLRSLRCVRSKLFSICTCHPTPRSLSRCRAVSEPGSGIADKHLSPSTSQTTSRPVILPCNESGSAESKSAWFLAGMHNNACLKTARCLSNSCVSNNRAAARKSRLSNSITGSTADSLKFRQVRSALGYRVEVFNSILFRNWANHPSLSCKPSSRGVNRELRDQQTQKSITSGLSR